MLDVSVISALFLISKYLQKKKKNEGTLKSQIGSRWAKYSSWKSLLIQYTLCNSLRSKWCDNGQWKLESSTQNHTENQSEILKLQADPIGMIFITVTHNVSSVYGHHVPVCTSDNVWKCSWWDGGLCPGGSPPRPISELLNYLWCDLVALDALIHNVWDILNWIQVWGTWGPVNGVNASII